VRSDFSIEQGEIIKRASCGCRKVLIRDLKSGSAFRAEEREGLGESGRALGGTTCVRVVSELESLSVFCNREEDKISPCLRGEKDNHPI